MSGAMSAIANVDVHSELHDHTWLLTSRRCLLASLAFLSSSLRAASCSTAALDHPEHHAFRQHDSRNTTIKFSVFLKADVQPKNQMQTHGRSADQENHAGIGCSMQNERHSSLNYALRTSSRAAALLPTAAALAAGI